jgi:CheY-like chemotaxis protein
MDKQTVQLLLVEDEKAHAELVRRAFEPLSDRFHLKVASCLKEALKEYSEILYIK